jgi:hypothetical protein
MTQTSLSPGFQSGGWYTRLHFDKPAARRRL